MILPYKSLCITHRIISICVAIYKCKLSSNIFIVDLAYVVLGWTPYFGDSCYFTFVPLTLSKIHTLFKFEKYLYKYNCTGLGFPFFTGIFFFFFFALCRRLDRDELSFYLCCYWRYFVPNHSLLLRESPPEHLFERDSHVHVSSSHETGFLSLYMNANPDIFLVGSILVEFAFR